MYNYVIIFQRSNQRPRPAERVVTAEGVYANNFFMHAATSHVGTIVKVNITSYLFFHNHCFVVQIEQSLFPICS